MYKFYVLSFSGGKDSTCLLTRIIEDGMPLTHCVFYDTGMEFDSVYRNVDKARKMVEAYGAEMVVLKPKSDFLYDMFLKPKNCRDGEKRYGNDWCGGPCRWRTAGKVGEIKKFLKTLGNPGDYIQYIGIAADEPKRLVYEDYKAYPLADMWHMTEAECLAYCYEHGWDWKEGSSQVELYGGLLDRVSCKCCANKNLKELRNIYHYLPEVWDLLCAMQSRIDRPFHAGKSIFDYEERFRREDAQLSAFLPIQTPPLISDEIKDELLFRDSESLSRGSEWERGAGTDTA